MTHIERLKVKEDAIKLDRFEVKKCFESEITIYVDEYLNYCYEIDGQLYDEEYDAFIIARDKHLKKEIET